MKRIPSPHLTRRRFVRSAAISATARKTLGLAALQQVLAGTLTLEDAIADIQQATRRYAKRQQTWFRRETWMTVIDAAGRGAEEVATEIVEFF